MHSPSALRGPAASTVPAVLLVTLAGPALATNYTWIDPAGGSANDPFNWSPFGIPRAQDNVFFGPNASYNVLFPADTVPVDTLTALTVQSGRPRFNIPSGLGIQGQLLVQSESLTVLSGQLRSSHFLVGSGATGKMLLSGSTTRLVARNAVGSYLGVGGDGYLKLLAARGSRATARCGWASPRPTSAPPR